MSVWCTNAYESYSEVQAHCHRAPIRGVVPGAAVPTGRAALGPLAARTAGSMAQAAAHSIRARNPAGSMNRRVLTTRFGDSSRCQRLNFARGSYVLKARELLFRRSLRRGPCQIEPYLRPPLASRRTAAAGTSPMGARWRVGVARCVYTWFYACCALSPARTHGHETSAGAKRAKTRRKQRRHACTHCWRTAQGESHRKDYFRVALQSTTNGPRSCHKC
jgi:hypothetical protein